MFRQTKGIVMMSKEWSTKIVNFMTLKAGILVVGHTVNMQYVYTRAWNRKIKYKAIMTKEGSAKIVNFITIGAWGVLC